MITADDLCARKAGRTLLKGISLTVLPGRVSVVIGPNGAGKSMLARHLAGLVAPAGGAVMLEDRPITRFSPRERARRIGYLPQKRPVHWPVPVREMVQLGASVRPLKERDTAIAAALAACKLTDMADRTVDTLSGGEVMRAHLARLLAGGHQSLILDEPTEGLDPAHALSAARLLRAAAARGIAVLVILHDLTLAARLADRLVLLDQGRITDAGTPGAVLRGAAIRNAFSLAFRVQEGADGLHVSWMQEKEPDAW